MNSQKSRILTQSQLTIERLSRHKRAAAALALASAFGVVTAFAVAPGGDQLPASLHTVVEQLSIPSVAVLPGAEQGYLREERIQRGDTTASLLSRLGVTDKEAFEFLRTNPTAQAISRQLRPGKAVTARTTDAGELLALHFPVNGKDALIVVERTAGGLVAAEQAVALETRTALRAGEIRYSLFGATDAAGIPDSIATQLADIFGGDIDFHRDLRKGDRFSVVYEMLYQRGQPVRGGRILAAEFTNDQKTFQAYWYASDNVKTGGYYGADGKNLRKAFLRSPLEFSRVTSGFTSNRFHPVLNTWRAHKGVDYGAPIGTRVRSVADGTVEFAGRQGGYGNLLIVRHHGAYTTAYAHLNGFAPGMRKGARVAQGDTIGYVGQTGLASGPHLHYEFRVRDQQVNPLAVTLPSAPPLGPADASRFQAATEALRTQLQLARESSGAVLAME
ncbi:M23 family metallopeptidase [Azospira restricta]|uniref:Peptidoglycan DD-metalloendopeptidase family protein n=1 Tax=Azospira restricta TaxID=404405 RepID=A0A974SRR3_9RHOO|nr:peptidoglycan DD-metalloendopeptidase family protein [Azospira restricta]QRJ65147.1 peptidoglycan DD-metalloendopeptidase family protein [Azospira restricta]